MKFYEEKEAELIAQRGGIVPKYALSNPPNPSNPNNPQQHQNQVNEIFTKKQFLDSKIIEIRKEFPNLNEKQVNTRANMMWKNSRKK